MSKNIQIPQELFINLCRYFLLQDTEPSEAIIKGLESKLEAIMRHELYTSYKDTKLSPEERQEARKRYLDSVGMHDSFRWKTLEPPT